MKNSAFFTILLFMLIYQFDLVAAFGRLVPLYHDTTTNQWYVLLLKGKQYWTDFYYDPQIYLPRQVSPKDAALFRFEADSKIYKESDITSFSAAKTTAKGDTLYFAILKTDKGVNENLAWVPVNNIRNTKGDITPPGKRENISRGVLSMLREFLPPIIKTLTTPIAKQPTPAAAPTSKPAKKYKNLLEFINDPNPHMPNEWLEAWKGVPEFEDAVDWGWVDRFFIDFSELREDDGTPLSKEQIQKIKSYLEKAGGRFDEYNFRFANNNFEILTQDPKDPPNPMWKYVHNFLNRLPCLKERLKGIGLGPCPPIEMQLKMSAAAATPTPQPTDQLKNALSALEQALKTLKVKLR